MPAKRSHSPGCAHNDSKRQAPPRLALCVHCGRNEHGRMVGLRCGHVFHDYCYELLVGAFGDHRCMTCFVSGAESCGSVAREWRGPDSPS